MAKLPQIKTLTSEDFPDFEGVDKLLQPLNSFMESVVIALNNQLTVSENLIGLEREVIVKTDGSGNLRETPKVLWTLRQRQPQHCFVTRIILKSGTNPSAATSIIWSFDGSQVSLDNIYGLAVSSEYIISLIILGR